MSAVEASPDEGARLWDEVIAGHGLVTRGAEAVAASFTRLAAGAAVETRPLVLTARWLIDVARHHVSREEPLWPLLRESPHRAVARLDVLSEEHEALGEELDALTKAVEQIAKEREAGGSVGWGRAMKQGTQASHRILNLLGDHLAAEEAVLKTLFPAVPETSAVELRKAVADGVPLSDPHLVLGFLEHPEPLPGREQIHLRFPPWVRWARAPLTRSFRRTLKALDVHC
ncbi:hemerythrin domain-containing protein [Streptomyces anthocyanicus]|uniref:hemerythrin domain-containing protein n=1 Tax=Streptomyces anthocyanicus TaxID=68174 RepID=UPI002F90F219|nr:hemerythrin domain-containing protein [Streptomyces anthocyanicus]